ncbi:hypothetical protein THASP1DRAFT_33639 [Thamnocephalis sphaerospora]|uniref:Uncharacterized protein n=1 Tax=Thamnocephalis sphaerospora TaxID=78915 RepID=A0A4P9XG82_9FUNG|nr:hypothetical protein THASP1DRAFT_33639 [Thamnocephalis sphaerospora]|eukprot:RKP04578.1 hypothetical protein THASP1DRAFT_33639 [Thamnocephalis sphaerospora]
MVTSQMTDRRNGLIINVGSIAAITPSPLLPVYTGAKAFIRSWSQALGSGLADKGVVVVCLDVYFVLSNMFKRHNASYMVPTADAYVKHVLKRIGLTEGASVPYANSPYLPHAALIWAVEHLVPSKWMLDHGYLFLLSHHRGMQISALKERLAKRAKEAAAQRAE